MKTIKWTHKIHKTHKYAEKCPLRKTDSIYLSGPNNLLC